MNKTVVAIGNFDGVHIGHQSMIRHAEMVAKKHGYDLCVLTFTPHPRQFFQPNVAPFRITPDDIKQRLITTQFNINHYVALNFNDGLQHMGADDFINDILIERLNAAIVIVGNNFHFGYKRSGTIDTLAGCDAFETIIADMVDIDNQRVSSTRIRDHLKNAEINQANSLLGWDWFIESAVVHGDKRGREIGYPTANMHFGDTIVPSYGVYAVKVQTQGSDEWLNGAANIGIRPMFETAMPMVETYIFDFDGDLYDQPLKIRPIQKIRDEMNFDNLDDLIKQIDADCAVTKNILSS